MSKFKFAGHHKLGLAIVVAGLLAGASSTIVPASLSSYVTVLGIGLILAGLWLIFPSSFNF